MTEIVEELYNAYGNKVAQGMCAHAAWALVVNFGYLRGKEEGLDTSSVRMLIHQVQQRIKTSWEKQDGI